MIAVAEIDGQGRITYAYLNQGEHWLAKERPIAVADMDPTWRRNAARWMERRAQYFAMLYGFGELFILGARTMRNVIGELDGQAVEAGPRFSHLDMMSDHAVDGLEEAQAERDRDPVGWIRTTALHRALVADLPVEVAA